MFGNAFCVAEVSLNKMRLPMELEHQDIADTRIITVIDSRIDIAVALQFKDAVRSCTTGGPVRVVLDLKYVNFIDSSGLGAIVAAKKLLHGKHDLELAGLRPLVQKVSKNLEIVVK